MTKRLIGALLISLLSATAAQAMDVATYLAKADALRASGMAAMFSSEAKELQAEMRLQVAALKEERLAALRAGRPQAYCPPAKATLQPEEILAVMRAVTPRRRSATPVRAALRTAFARKYPCRR